MKYKYNDEWNNLKVKVSDTLPIGSIVEYDGDTVPDGYEEVEETSGTTLYNGSESVTTGSTVQLNDNCNNYKKIDIVFVISGLHICLTAYAPYEGVWSESVWAGGGFERVIKVTFSNNILTMDEILYGTFSGSGNETATLLKVVGYK